MRSLGRPRLSGWGIAAVLVTGAALLANWRIVGAKVRNAAPREGGKLIETEIVTANVKVEGAGPTIVMIHGFSAAIGWWDPISDDLATDHQVVRLDLIGHGGTAAPRAGYAIERQAALVSAVLDNLGVESAKVIGHSMGGEVATALVEMRPNSRRTSRPHQLASDSRRSIHARDAGLFNVCYRGGDVAIHDRQ